MLVWLVLGAIQFPCCYVFVYGTTALTITAGNSQSPKYWPDKQTIDKQNIVFLIDFIDFFKNCKPPSQYSAFDVSGMEFACDGLPGDLHKTACHCSAVARSQ